MNTRLQRVVSWKRVVLACSIVYFGARGIALVKLHRDGSSHNQDSGAVPNADVIRLRHPTVRMTGSKTTAGQALEEPFGVQESSAVPEFLLAMPRTPVQSGRLRGNPLFMSNTSAWLWRLAAWLGEPIDYPAVQERKISDVSVGHWPELRWAKSLNPEGPRELKQSKLLAGRSIVSISARSTITGDNSNRPTKQTIFANGSALSFSRPLSTSPALLPQLPPATPQSPRRSYQSQVAPQISPINRFSAFELQMAVDESVKHFPDSKGFPWYARMEPVFFPAAWKAFKEFIAGGSSAFPIFLDETCTFGRTWKKNREMAINFKRGPKYAQEALIPFRMRQTRWHTTDPNRSKASLIVSFARTHHQRFRLDCLHRLKTTSTSYQQETSFFLYAGDRGPCCDGGQYAQPDWLSHHVIATHGEDSTAPFVFREGKGPHQYSSNDTAPPLSCFDKVKDIGMPASATVLVGAADSPPSTITSCSVRAAERSVLAMFAGGRSSPREYELRKTLLVHWAEGKVVSEHPDMLLRYSMERKYHNETMWRSKFCLVVEGYAPWTPRLEEAIAASCVPVVLSQRWRGPYMGLIDYSKFAVVLDEPFSRIETLRGILIEKVANGDYARLFCHLQLVKPLFRYRKDSIGTEDDDSITMLAFEMYNKLYDSPPLKGAPAVRRPPILAHVETTADGWLRVKGAPPLRETVTYTCESEGRTCLVDVAGVEWNCTSIMEPTRDYPDLDEDGDFKQCTCFRKDKKWIMPPSIRRSIPINYWDEIDPPAQNRYACPATKNFSHLQWKSCPGKFKSKKK
jgi:hypothetical protein